MICEAGKASINHSPWHRFYRIFSSCFLVEEIKGLGENHHAQSRVLKALPMYTQAGNQIRVTELKGRHVTTELKGRHVTTLPTVHP